MKKGDEGFDDSLRKHNGDVLLEKYLYLYRVLWISRGKHFGATWTGKRLFDRAFVNYQKRSGKKKSGVNRSFNEKDSQGRYQLSGVSADSIPYFRKSVTKCKKELLNYKQDRDKKTDKAIITRLLWIPTTTDYPFNDLRKYPKFNECEPDSDSETEARIFLHQRYCPSHNRRSAAPDAVVACTCEYGLHMGRRIV